MPVPASGGRIRRVTGVPLWRPTPTHPTGTRTVCSNGKAIPNEQITPPPLSCSVVFLQQTVATKKLFNRIDLGRTGVKQAGRRVIVVSHPQQDLLRNGFSVPFCEDHMWSVDPLFYSPVAVNRGFLVAVAVSRIAAAEPFLQRQIRVRRSQNSNRRILRIDARE